MILGLGVWGIGLRASFGNGLQIVGICRVGKDGTRLLQQSVALWRGLRSAELEYSCM